MLWRKRELWTSSMDWYYFKVSICTVPRITWLLWLVVEFQNWSFALSLKPSVSLICLNLSNSWTCTYNAIGMHLDYLHTQNVTIMGTCRMRDLNICQNNYAQFWPLNHEPRYYTLCIVEPTAPDLHTKCGICLLIPTKRSIVAASSATRVEWIREQGKPCWACSKTEFSNFHDKTLQRSIDELKVQCTHLKRGCDWTGELGKHLNVKPSVCDDLLIGCDLANIECGFSCAGCKAQMPRN